VTVRKIALPALVITLALTGCGSREGEIAMGGITAVRSACPAVGIPAGTGDITLFDPPASVEASAIDVTAVMTNVTSACNDQGETIQTTVSFDVQARRARADAARDVVLPYFITVVQGGTSVVAKRVGRVQVHFAAGALRASTVGQATTGVSRAAATLDPEMRKLITRKRKAGDDDAAVDPLAQPEVRAAVLRASFEALVGFQLTDAQLKYNATR
jgi:hypothetical protein